MSDPAKRPPLLFDMDGVLVHSHACWRILCKAAAHHFGAPPLTDEAFEAGWGQGVEADLQTWFRGCGLQPERLGAYYQAHFLEHATELRVEPGAAAVLQTLRRRRQPLCVVTNTEQALAEGILSFAGLEPGRIIGARPGLAEKPAPDLLLEACRQLGVQAEDVWMIGDSRYDADAARAAGIRFAGFRRAGDRRLEQLEEAALLT